MEYGAIDLHTRQSQIRIVDAAGTVVLERRVETRAAALTAVFGGRARQRICWKAGRRAGGSPSTSRRWATR